MSKIIASYVIKYKDLIGFDNYDIFIASLQVGSLFLVFASMSDNCQAGFVVSIELINSET